MTVATLEAPTDELLRIVVASATDVGGRAGNEDAVAVETLPPIGEGESALDGGYLAILADGMGGYQRGEVASEMAIEIVKEMFAADPGADSALLLKQAFRRANDRMYANGQGAVPPQMMGTTLVVAAVRGKYVTIANIGDSRAYLARAGRLTQVTKDHSLVADQVAAGSMTEEEARESPHRNILTHALGHRAKLDAKMPNIFELTLLPEDQLLLCTDGFYDVVPSADLLNVLLTNDANDATVRLIELAKERGTSDNVSAVVISVQPTREPQVTGAELDLASAPSRLPLIILGVVAILVAIALLAFFFVL